MVTELVQWIEGHLPLLNQDPANIDLDHSAHWWPLQPPVLAAAACQNLPLAGLV